MEEHRDLILSGKTAVIEANLRDEKFSKMVADFLGSQTGEGLELYKAPCRNRFLIQVALMREDNNFTWSAVVEWLKMILPGHQSADFRCLIETGIATTLSLGQDARQIFLESYVNFNFVGPICDSIGVERTDLLEIRDFSERAKSIELTNGLIFELSNFVTREKMDPIILVTWLRNFIPQFCMDGDTQKAYKILRSKIKKLKLLYRNCQTRSHRRNLTMETLLQSPFELVPRKVYGRRSGANKRLKKEHLLDYENIKEEPGSFSIMQDEEKPFRHTDSHENNINVKGHAPLSDEDAQAINTLNKEYECSSLSVKPRDALTLLDIASSSFQRLTSRYGRNTYSKQVFIDLLKNQYAMSCKEHPALMEFETTIEPLVSNHSLASPLCFLNFNANFLVDVYDSIEQHMISFEKEILESTGEKLGRDKNPKFKKFLNFSESATSRYIHMACEVLTPHAVSKQNRSKHWEAFCKEKLNPSRLVVNLSHHFNNYFEAAAALIHHHREIPLFFSDLLLMNDDDCPNIIQESVNADANDGVVQSLVCVLAIVYCKILGPYCQLLKSEAQYSLYGHYILCLYQRFLEWSKNPSTLLEPDNNMNVFLQDPQQENTYNGVFDYCGLWHTNRDLITSCLKKLVKEIAAVTEVRLKDFLPGGKYSQGPLPDTSSAVASCTFSVLMGEYAFGEEHPRKKKQLVAVKRKRRVRSPSKSSEEEDDQSDSDKVVLEKSHGAKKAHNLHEHNKKLWLGGVTLRHEPNQSNALLVNLDRKDIIATVNKNGGPCKTQQDVDKLLLRFDGKPRADKREALLCEILYQKIVLDNNDSNLDDIYNGHLATKLKLSLPKIRPSFSFVLAPKLTKPK